MIAASSKVRGARGAATAQEGRADRRHHKYNMCAQRITKKASHAHNMNRVVVGGVTIIEE